MAETLETKSTMPEVVPPASSVLAVLNRTTHDASLDYAHRHPRSVREFLHDASDLVTLSVDVASECIYALPRKDADGKTKMIRGPSIRLAEILHSTYNNCTVEVRGVGEDGTYVTARAVFTDLQRNVHTAVESQRRIVDKRGRKYSVDMVGTTANAAASIARRNAILAGIPQALWLPVLKAAEKTIAGDARPLAERREKALAHFQKAHGVSPDRIFARLDVAGVEDLGGDELTTLQGLKEAIKDGEISVDEAFPPLTPHVAPGATRGDEIKSLLAAGANAPKATPAAAEAPPEPELDLVDPETGEVLGIADERARPPE